MAESMDKKYSNVPNLRYENFLLGDLAEVITKGTTPHLFVESGINFIKIESIDSRWILNDKVAHVTNDEHYGFLSRSILKENDILFSIAGALGLVYIVNKSDLPANTNQALSIIRLQDKNLVEYVSWFLESSKVKKTIGEIKSIGAQPNLSLDQVRKFKISIPNDTNIIKKTTTLLNLLEERISTQNKIIRDLKAEFLFLLNSCFAGEKNATIGAYIMEESHRNKQNKEYPVFSVSNKRGFIPQNEQFDDREVASNDKTNYKIVSLNQFAYNPARINVGSIGLYKNETPCIISPMYNVFSVVSIDPFILELYFKSSYFINEMNKRLEGSVRMCLTIDGLKGIKFHLPSQTFLNSFSKAMDVLKRKIELEENLLSFYQTQKKYLLANLFI